jgi:hypothetical protein
MFDNFQGGVLGERRGTYRQTQENQVALLNKSIMPRKAVLSSQPFDML